MGDVPTHHAIFEEGVRPALESIRPDEDYQYVRLGNFLTDLSQVRDTLAYATAKTRIWKEAQDSSWLLKVPILGRILLNIAQIPEYIEELLTATNLPIGIPKVAPANPAAVIGTTDGKTTRVEDAALAKYLESLVLCFTLEIFATGEGLPEQEVLRVFGRNFTRYYPHEHLDFPPWPYTNPVGTRDIDIAERMLRSLAEQMMYIIQSLTAVENSWTLSLNQGHASHARHDALTDLGHTLHAIEDFYFHTNFLELLQTLRLQERFSEPDPLNPKGFADWFQHHGLDDLPLEENSVRFLRRFYRRMQRPVVGDDPSTVSSTTSMGAFSYLSTGGFGATDIFHTLYGALLGLQAHVTPQLMDLMTNRLKLVIVKDLLLEDERKKLGCNQFFNDQLKAHKDHLDDPDFDTAVDAAVAEQLLSSSAGAALKYATALDRQLTAKYKEAPGIGGFLLSIAKIIQQKHDESEALSVTLDTQLKVIDRRSVYCESTPTGPRCASAETIGTHSLLAKDTKTSFPFRQRALAYATFVSSFFALTMAERLGSQGDLDWRPVVTQFLRYPDIDPGSWESQLLQAVSAPAGRLDFTRLRERPELKAFPADSRVPALFRMQLAKRNLANQYDAEAEAANQEWLNR